MNPPPSRRLPEMTSEELEQLITSAVIAGTRPLQETIERQQQRILELESGQYQLSQTVAMWAQQLKNALNPKSRNKPSRQEKQLKNLSAALSSWHLYHQELLASVNALNEKLSAETPRS